MFYPEASLFSPGGGVVVELLANQTEGRSKFRNLGGRKEAYPKFDEQAFCADGSVETSSSSKSFMNKE